MKEPTSNERVVQVVGIDLAQRSFPVDGVDERGQRVISQSFNRTRLSELMANLPACTVAMAACGSAHAWARPFRDDGHEVRLMAPQFVKP
jgi:transposase